MQNASQVVPCFCAQEFKLKKYENTTKDIGLFTLHVIKDASRPTGKEETVLYAYEKCKVHQIFMKIQYGE